ncbi:hypothetical protein QBA54_49115 [Streptomyces sp. B21-108]|uniref:hypothetical protein n=1 Tax=Streptomyces sp. B21-108 TaxID=3039419 RepID=UPI002FF35009
MIALVRYMFSVLLLSQRYLAPLLLFLGLVAVLTSSDTGPLTATYASVAGAMLLCSVSRTSHTARSSSSAPAAIYASCLQRLGQQLCGACC